MARRSYYTRLRSRPLPKRSRTIPVPGNSERGDGEDDGRYYRCWNCGFICDSDRDALGDDRSLNGLSYSVQESVGSSEENSLIILANLRSGHVIPKAGADGTAAVIRLPYYPSSATGCSFCGTLNWRGDF
jgi:hypothetical protein